MTALWIYAYVILPLVVIAMGYGATRLDRPRHSDPAE